VARVTFAGRATLASILADPWLRFGDAYSDGRVAIEGDLVSLLETIYHASGMGGGTRGVVAAPRGGALRRQHLNSLAASRDNIHHHYDIGNDFYALWLGSTMAYTCAYYPTPAATLDEAAVRQDGSRVPQVARLNADESVGGSGLRLGHAGPAHGAPLRSAGARVQHLAPADRVCPRARGGEAWPRAWSKWRTDYRNIAEVLRCLCVVGMLEHVGPANYTALGHIAYRCWRARSRAHPLDRSHPPGDAAAVDREAHLPGAYPPSRW